MEVFHALKNKKKKRIIYIIILKIVTLLIKILHAKNVLQVVL